MSDRPVPGHTGAVPPSGEPYDLAVRVIPRARRDEVGGERAGRLVVRTTAAPVDGKANAAVCRLVAAHLGVPHRWITLSSGERSRDKILRVDMSQGGRVGLRQAVVDIAEARNQR